MVSIAMVGTTLYQLFETLKVVIERLIRELLNVVDLLLELV